MLSVVSIDQRSKKRMKKLILAFVVAVTSFGAYAQTKADIVTKHRHMQTMVWSDTEGEYMFFDQDDYGRTDYSVFWQFELKEIGTGYIKMNDIETGKYYEFSVYKWEIRTDKNGKQFIWIDFIEPITSDRGTILFNDYSGEGKMISIFMPESKLAIFFDSLKQ